MKVAVLAIKKGKHVAASDKSSIFQLALRKGRTQRKRSSCLRFLAQLRAFQLLKQVLLHMDAHRSVRVVSLVKVCMCPKLVKSRARAAVSLFHLEPNQKGQVSHVGLHTHFGSQRNFPFPNSSSTLLDNGVCSKACNTVSWRSKLFQAIASQKSLLLPTSNFLQRT